MDSSLGKSILFVKIGGKFNKFWAINMFESLYIWGEKFFNFFEFFIFISCNEFFGNN